MLGADARKATRGTSMALGLEQMKIGFFEAKCADCGSIFAKPELGDFAYGQFLFTGERGTVYAYFDAIDHPVWTRLDGGAVGEDCPFREYVQCI